MLLLIALAIFVAGPLCSNVSAASKKKKDGPPQIEITIVPGALRYATTRFDATAGLPIELTLKNTCVMPHNLVLVAPGKVDAIFEQAMALTDGLAKNYVPDSPAVLAATTVRDALLRAESRPRRRSFSEP